MTRRINVVAVIAGVMMAASLGCTTNTEAPPLTGPSGLATPTSALVPVPPTASFTFLPSTPTGDQKVYFDGSGSTGPNPITAYSWDFGDGTPLGSGVAPIHQFNGCSSNPANGTSVTFVVQLKVTDSLGRESVAPASRVVIVTKCKS